MADVEQLQQQVQQLRAELQADPAAQQRVIQGETLYQRALDRVPIYTGDSKQSFRQHLHNFGIWRLTRGIADPERAKLALAYSLRDTAGERIRAMGPGTAPYMNATEYEEYETLIRETFLPSGERALSRSEFIAYKQDAQEDCGSYVSIKMSLYQVAYLPEERSFITLRNAVIRGLYSDIIKRLTLRSNPTDEETLRAAIFTAVAGEREAYAEGYAESTSLDGLRAVTQYSAMTRRTRDAEEPMEIGAVGGGQGGSQGGSQGGARGKGCFNCGLNGHYARDCKRSGGKASGRSFNKRQGGGNGGGGGGGRRDGQQKETRTCRHCNKRGHLQRDCFQLQRKEGKKAVNNIEEDWEEILEEETVNQMAEVSHHFLGDRPLWTRRK